MCGRTTFNFQQIMDQPGKKVVKIARRGELKKKSVSSLSSFVPENLVSRYRFGRPVPRQHVGSPRSGSIWCSLTTEGCSPTFRGDVHFYNINGCTAWGCRSYTHNTHAS